MMSIFIYVLFQKFHRIFNIQVITHFGLILHKDLYLYSFFLNAYGCLSQHNWLKRASFLHELPLYHIQKSADRVCCVYSCPLTVDLCIYSFTSATLPYFLQLLVSPTWEQQESSSPVVLQTCVSNSKFRLSVYLFELVVDIY